MLTPLARVDRAQDARRSRCTISGARPNDGSSSSSSSGRSISARADRQHLLLAAGERAGLLAPPLRQARKVANTSLDVARRRRPCRAARARPGAGSPRPTRSVKVPRPSGTCATPRRTMSSVARAVDAAGRRRRRSPCVRTMLADGAQRGRLAGAVGAEDGGDARRLEREVDAVQHLRRRRRAACRPWTSSSAGGARHWRRLPDRPAITSGCVWMCAGVPSAILRPKLSATTWSGHAHHQAHVVLDQQHGDARGDRGCRGSASSSAVSSSWFRPAAGSSSSSSFGSAASARAELDALLSARTAGHRPARLANGVETEVVHDARAPARAAAFPRRPPHGRRNALDTKPADERACAPTITLSVTLSERNIARFWNVRPMPSAGDAVRRRRCSRRLALEQDVARLDTGTGGSCS